MPPIAPGRRRGRQSPTAPEARAETQEVTQQPVDDESARDRTRRAPDCDASRRQRRDPKQNRNERNLRHGDDAPPPPGRQHASPYAVAGTASRASSSSIRFSITFSPIDQKFGSEASRPNGASNSL